jgi:Uma2 family endonuclease
MTRSVTRFPAGSSVADLLEQLGRIPPHRIRLDPLPGRATEKDVIRIQDRENRLYELVDGVLVEKVMGLLESALAAELIGMLRSIVEQRDEGFVTGADGTYRLMAGLVRIPDLAFTLWTRIGRKEFPREPIPDLVPDLAVEVLSENNTEQEMLRKLKEYFLAGVRLVWLVDPAKRIVRVYVAPDRETLLTEEETLTGGDVLPGPALPLRQVFARVPRDLRPTAKPRTTRKSSRKKRS